MKQVEIINAVSKLALVSAMGLMVACGSSGSDTPADASISGTIVAAPVDGADVSVTDVNGNVVVDPVQTDANGHYSLVIPNGSLGQDLIIKSTGGTFTDEATNLTGTVGDGEMYAYVSANSLSNGDTVCATPGSTIVANLAMNPNITVTMAEAEAAFASAFGYTPDMSVTPADATTVPAVDETAEATLAGFRAGVFSQLAMDLGLSQDDQFALFAALAQDMSDNVLDGVDASGPVAIGTTGFTLEADIQNRFAMALVSFEQNTNNLTGLDKDEIGDVPFAKVALTTNYQIEYKPLGMMAPVNGKDTFQIEVTHRSDGTPAPGLTTMLMPMMYMPLDHKHSTPMGIPTINDEGNGLYTVTLYYLMPTAMGGYWDLKFMVDGEEAHFYPTVMMAMGDTAQVRLKGVDDKIMDMSGLETSRPYFIFKEALTAGSSMGLYDFSVFVATRKTMMDFPVIVDAADLGGVLSLVVDINTTEVSISVNGGAYALITTSGTDGIWSATDLSLNDGVENEIRVKLTVNGEVKTTSGLAQEVDVNDFQTFTVTPGMTM